MEKDNLSFLSTAWAKRLRVIDYDSLPISDYNKRYIRSIRPALDYYMCIFAHCLRWGIRSAGSEPSALTLIDYGGGSGFLSLLAKEAGFKQVIYIDRNPLSVETVQVLKQQTGTGPDVILVGDSDALASYCRTQGIYPQLLIATDLIEHVYNLADFFADLCTINSGMQMIFTTASTPFNPWVKRRLHHIMTECESGTLESPNYLSKRETFIRQHYPHFSAEQVAVWSRHTRGLIYTDIHKAIRSGHLPLLTDRYNTCDPETGNCTERILPIRVYRSLLAFYGYTLSIEKGFYNVLRNNLLFAVFCRFLNTLIRFSGHAGLLLSPFIIFYCKTELHRNK